MEIVVYDFAIVGAGISGLNIGWKLHSLKSSVLILEKSKSCGGRMATRRIGESKFDHGAQFIKRSEASESLMEFWSSKNILEKFPIADNDFYFGTGGMTRLTKEISQNLNIKYNSKVTTLKKTDQGLKLILDNGESIVSKHVILSCPLPQSVELLKHSDIAFDSRLENVNYSKSIVNLISVQYPLHENLKFVENFNKDIYSICSQKIKGLSIDYSYAVVMSDEWSETNFPLPDDEIKEKSMAVLKSNFGSINVSDFQIKKWRYCQPTSTWPELYHKPRENIYLVGDAFGGASVNGALRSADHVFKIIFTKMI